MVIGEGVSGCGVAGGANSSIHPPTHPTTHPSHPSTPIHRSHLLGVISRGDHILLESVEARLEELDPRHLVRVRVRVRVRGWGYAYA